MPPFEFDLESLLAPIAGEHPTGIPLQYEGAYDRIAEARREGDASLSQGVWKSEVKRADWPLVERLCVAELTARTKDLRIAGWLLEAWIHLHGFAGAAMGLHLILELARRFWEGLYPRIDGDDLEYRTAPIHWINEKLPVQLKLIAITSPEDDDVKPLAWADWESACRTEVTNPKAPSGSDSSKLKPSVAGFQRSVMFTSTAFLAGAASELELAMEQCTAVESLFDQQCGEQSPSLRQFWNVLESIHSLIVSFLVHRQSDEEGAAASSEVETPALASGDPGDSLIGSIRAPQIGSRDEAYRRIAEAADYLMRIEPHSPAPYLIRRAIQWGSMNLADLLPELVRNQTELNEIFHLLQLGKGNAADNR